MNWLDATIEWLNKPERTREYKLAVEEKASKGYWINQWDAELCYITLGKTLKELQKHQSGVLRLYKAGKGCICVARFFYDSPNTMCLGDIEIIKKKQEDKGYGSKVMSSFIEICRQLKIKSIMSEISEVDRGHLDKLNHFHSKHGFKLTMYKQRKNGVMIGKAERKLSNHSES